MNIKRIVPNITFHQIEQSRSFYADFLGMQLAMDMGWILTFASPGNPTAQITLLQETSLSFPNPNVSIEVEDVDAVYSKAVKLGLKILYPIANEAWGVRRFFVSDPNGIVINIMSHLK